MLRAFELASIVPVPWKNGGGLTRELACWPVDSATDAFDWRVSIASVDASGPFSKFPGVDRSILLLEGAGMRLRSADGSVDHPLVVPREPFAFSGDLDIACELFGASRDFNVMSRRGRIHAQVRILRDRDRLAASSAGLLFAISGSWTAHASSLHRLTANTGVWWTEESQQWELAPARHADANSLIVVSFAASAAVSPAASRSTH